MRSQSRGEKELLMLKRSQGEERLGGSGSGRQSERELKGHGEENRDHEESCEGEEI